MASPQEIEVAEQLVQQLRQVCAMALGLDDGFARTPGLVYELRSFTRMGEELTRALNRHSGELAQNTRALQQHAMAMQDHTQALLRAGRS
jgi:hypothetical protein